MGSLTRLTTTHSPITAALRASPLAATRPVSALSLAPAAASSAAAVAVSVQFDSDSDSDAGDEETPAAYTDTAASRSTREVQWVFMGNPNSKRHVYAGMLSKLLQVPHISITSLLRQDLCPRSPIYKQIAEAVNHGKLVPESIIFGLLSKRLEDGHDRGETGFILDGIPRTRLQAEILDQLVDIDLVVNFKCSEDCFQPRSAPNRSACSSRSRTTFSCPDFVTEHAGPKVSSFYKEQVKLLEDYYQNQKKLMDFQVRNAPAETWKGLVAALHLQHINAVHSSRALTMDFRIS